MKLRLLFFYATISDRIVRGLAGHQRGGSRTVDIDAARVSMGIVSFNHHHPFLADRHADRARSLYQPKMRVHTRDPDY